MQRKVNFPKNSKLLVLSILTAAAFTSSTVTLAAHHHRHHHKQVTPPADQVVTYKNEGMLPVAAFEPNWYVGGHIGESRTHDKAAVGSGDSVTQIGPGWEADLGYRFLEYRQAILAAELGYIQYHQSNETVPGVNVASTEHFASYLAAVVQYPLCYSFNIFGKLGGAYSYAKKVFEVTGVSRSANTFSLYWGGGLSYNMTSKASLDLQWDRVRGNNKTGSTDMLSLGVTYSFL